jgi:RNA polymerase sigma-70 factor (ECF subfamily)
MEASLLPTGTQGTPAVQDELALLARARRLDQDALAEIHDTYYPSIYRYVAYRVGDPHTAEDLTSEVFVRLLKALRDRHAPQNSLQGWLYGVASNVVNDYRRRHYRAAATPLDDSLASQNGLPAEIVEASLTREALLAAMNELTEEQRTVIALRFGSDLPIHDVAETMGKTEGAVKQLQARAVAALARRLGAEAG